jgi:hypothetical protein
VSEVDDRRDLLGEYPEDEGVVLVRTQLNRASVAAGADDLVALCGGGVIASRL